MTTETPVDTDSRKPEHLDWLLALTAIPTAAGHEGRVVRWIEHWLDNRSGFVTQTDPHGNIEIRIAGCAESDHPIYFTAHLDHPAFVVEEVCSETELILSFRGGVMSDYFPDAIIRVHYADDAFSLCTIAGEHEPTPEGEKDERPFKLYRAVGGRPHHAELGDIATWDLPEATIIDDEFGGIVHTNACDDLAALAAALAAIDELRLAKNAGAEVGDVRVLLTRAEEVGFIGAIGASKDGFMPKGSRIIALENSRAFPDSPIHGGPIVRVGDRISIFSPELTGAVAKVAERIAGGPAAPTASQKMSDMPKWKWQRKLMAGGACEASVYCAYGYCATCVCLPLGNYHNMANLSEVQDGSFNGVPRVGREYIGVDDYYGMVDLLVGCGMDLPASPGFVERLEKLWADKRFVVEQSPESGRA
ncbi:MAG: hypothetical protein KC996_02820 [Phycisphaerales bacterium]|nr:hypothetical protein [Phycisphaerales bacterium]